MKKLLVAVTTFAAILVSAAPVHAVSFNFSFTNQFPLGDVNGTVTGRIDGLADTGASAAIAVSTPAARPCLATHFLHQTTFFLSLQSPSRRILLR